MKALSFLVLISCLSAMHAQPRQGIFNDREDLQMAERGRAQPAEAANARLAVERLFAEDGPFHRAINAQPALYAALLFTVFDDYFTDEAFADGADGHQDRLCVLLMAHKLLPDELIGSDYAGERISLANVHFTELEDVWLDFAEENLLPAGVALPARPLPEELVEVPEAIRPLLSMLPTAADALAATGRLAEAVPFQEPFNRFMEVYVDHYPALSAKQRYEAFTDYQISWLREAHLKALFWLLIGRPLHQLVGQHPQLYGGLNADWLLPGAHLPEGVFPPFVERVYVPRGQRGARVQAVGGGEEEGGEDSDFEDSDSQDSDGEEGHGPDAVRGVRGRGRGRGRGGAVRGRGGGRGRGRGRGRGGGRVAGEPAHLADQLIAAPIEQPQNGPPLFLMPGLVVQAQPGQQQLREGQQVLFIVNPDGGVGQLVIADEQQYLQAFVPEEGRELIFQLPPQPAGEEAEAQAQVQANLPPAHEAAAADDVALPFPPLLLQVEPAPPPAFVPPSGRGTITIRDPPQHVIAQACQEQQRDAPLFRYHPEHSSTVFPGSGATEATCPAGKRKQEGGNSPDDGGGPPPAKQHKPDEPPKGSGGGSTGVAN